MDKKKLKRTAVLAVISILICLFVITAATYAWFTDNAKVNTNKVSTRTADANIGLYISSKGGNDFVEGTVADMVQINTEDMEKLMPVSGYYTEDGTDMEFVYVVIPGKYAPCSREQYLYHARVFLKVSGSANTSGTADIFLENKDDIFPAADSGILNAGRLALVIDGKPVVMYLTDDENPENDRISNTFIGEDPVDAGNVIRRNGSTYEAVADPAKKIDNYIYSDTDPCEPVATIEINRIYPVDIYFWLEGTDLDCSDSIATDKIDMQLYFYGLFDAYTE